MSNCLKEMLKEPRNFRMGRALPLIDDTDVSKRAVGAALIQEVRDDGFKEIKLIFHVGVHQDHEWC